MKKLAGLLFLFLPLTVSAQYRTTRSHPTLTYDLGASTGSYAGRSYSEIELGVNWYLQDCLVWRNSLFTRFGDQIDSASGLDTSARFVYNTPRDERGFGIGLFAGPGYRISNKENSGVFGEAGAVVKAGGLAIGGGVKSIQYSSPGHDANGNEYSRSDTVVFLILAGGGSF